ncbi:MAG: glycosyltransferase family 39 protein [Candidatus Moraniibacteriota bacterium]
MESLRRFAPRILLLMTVVFFVLSLVVSEQESTTMDEKAHIPSAYSYVRYGDMRLNPEHPPLLKDLAGLPLLALNVSFPVNDPLWENGINEQWVMGDKFINCSDPSSGVCNDANRVTFWSRIPITLIALLLGFFIFLWTKELAGPVAGLFAAMLYYFDPNIIGHSHYVTTDIGIAAFLFFSFYYFVKFLEKPTGKNVLLFGIFLGLAQLAKFSAVLVFPIFGMFAVLYGLTISTENEEHPWRKRLLSAWNYIWKYSVGVAICFVLIWILYYLNTMNMPGEKLDIIAGAVFPDRGLGPFAKEFVMATSHNGFLKPLSEYFLGVFMVFARVAGGNTYYFLGGVSNHASPWYFPLVFFLKATLPFLMLLILTTVYTLYRMGKTSVGENVGSFWKLLRVAFHSHIAQWLMVFFVLFYSYVSITGNLNIGFRHLFPILPFLYVLIAKTVFDILKRTEGEATGKVLRILLGGTALVIMAIPVLAYPSYLSYFNPIAGGHANGYRYVTDSNYDWGQDVKRLQKFVESYNLCVGTSFQETECQNLTEKTPPKTGPIDKIRVDYFGGSSPAYYLGNKYVSWHGESAPQAGWYAISVGFLQESIHKAKKPGEPSYEWLQAFDVEHPLARAGDSIFIYYIPEGSLPAAGK